MRRSVRQEGRAFKCRKSFPSGTMCLPLFGYCTRLFTPFPFTPSYLFIYSLWLPYEKIFRNSVPIRQTFIESVPNSTNFRRNLVDSVPNRLRIGESVPNRYHSLRNSEIEGTMVVTGNFKFLLIIRFFLFLQISRINGNHIGPGSIVDRFLRKFEGKIYRGYFRQVIKENQKTVRLGHIGNTQGRPRNFKDGEFFLKFQFSS